MQGTNWLRGTTQIPAKGQTLKTRNVCYAFGSTAISLLRCILIELLTVNKVLTADTGGFYPKTPVGNSHKSLNRRKLSADDFLSLSENNVLLNTFTVFSYQNNCSYCSVGFQNCQALWWLFLLPIKNWKAGLKYLFKKAPAMTIYIQAYSHNMSMIIVVRLP